MCAPVCARRTGPAAGSGRFRALRDPGKTAGRARLTMRASRSISAVTVPGWRRRDKARPDGRASPPRVRARAWRSEDPQDASSHLRLAKSFVLSGAARDTYPRNLPGEIAAQIIHRDRAESFCWHPRVVKHGEPPDTARSGMMNFDVSRGEEPELPWAVLDAHVGGAPVFEVDLLIGELGTNLVVLLCLSLPDEIAAHLGEPCSMVLALDGRRIEASRFDEFPARILHHRSLSLASPARLAAGTLLRLPAHWPGCSSLIAAGPPGGRQRPYVTGPSLPRP